MISKNKKLKFCNPSYVASLIMIAAGLMMVSISSGGCAYKIVKVKHPLVEDMRETLKGDILLKPDGTKFELSRGYCVTDQWLTDTAGLEVE